MTALFKVSADALYDVLLKAQDLEAEAEGRS